MSSSRQLRVAVVGGGMFFADVIGQALMDFERYGLAPYLGSIGQGRFARDLADVDIKFVAIGTHSPQRGTAGKIADWYREGVPDSEITPHYGDTVWEEIVTEASPDVLIVATPDDLHYAPIMHALGSGLDVITEKPLCLKLEQADEVIQAAQERTWQRSRCHHREAAVPEAGTGRRGHPGRAGRRADCQCRHAQALRSYERQALPRSRATDG